MKIPDMTRRNERGMAVIVMLALLSIMFACITVNIRSLNRLDRELKLMEQHQTRRLARLSVTNAPALPPAATTPAP